MYKKIVHNSPFRDSNSKGVDWINNLSLFNEGKCALWYNYPGPTRIIISNQKANNMSGVLDLAPLPGMKCEDCIFASEDNANHAPYLASGGESQYDFLFSFHNNFQFVILNSVCSTNIQTHLRNVFGCQQ